ncbi:P-loop containing nucleoside triphosphate hydrolase protein [Aspergillus crustosus]
MTETSIELDRRATFKDYLRVFTYATRWDILACVAGIVAAMGSGVTQPLLFALFGNFTSSFSTFAARDTDQDVEEFQSTINDLFLRVFAVFLARLGLTSIHKFSFRMVSIRLTAAVKLHYVRHLFKQSVHVLNSLPPGHAAGTITSSSNYLQVGLGENLGTLIEYTTRIVGSFTVAMIWSWELSLVSASGFAAVILIVGYLLSVAGKSRARQRKSEGEAASIASEALASIRTVMACGGQMHMVDRYSARVDEVKGHARATSPFIALQFGLMFLGVFSTMGLTFWYGTVIFTKSRLDDVGVIIVVLLSLTTLFFSLQRISGPIQAIGNASLAASEFFAVIDSPIIEAGNVKPPEVSAAEDIVFDQITFAYPSRPDVKVLDGLTLRIEGGKTTAIVGPSGAGKSTIVGLIQGWYTLRNQRGIAKVVQNRRRKDHDEDEDEQARISVVTKGESLVEPGGTITSCGHSLHELDIKWWRSQIGFVQQEPFLFNATIYENIARGLVGTKWEDYPEEKKRELVKEASREAFADEFIKKLPQGYDTKVGDGGIRLSGGQRQRIAIARAIIKRPAILILDEATSAIDVCGERIVQAALDRASVGRTTIIIAHRVSAVRNADHIVVLKQGAVVESGTHDSLLAIQDGAYAVLVQAQNHANDLVPVTKTTGSHGLLQSFGTLFFESKSHWPLMAISVTIAAAAGTTQPMFAWLLSKSIDTYKWQNNHPKLLDEAEFLAIMWTVFAISTGSAYFLAVLSSGRVGSFIRAKYQIQYFESLIYQRAEYFDEDDHSHGLLSSRIRDDPLKLEEMLGSNISQLCIATFTIIGGVAMAVAYSWKLALVSLAAVTPVCVLSGYIRFRYELQFDELNDYVFIESSRFASEAIGAFRTVLSLTLEESIHEQFEKLCQEHIHAAYNKARWALIFYYGGRLFARGEISIMAFFVCLMAIIYAAEGFGQTLSFGPNAAEADAAAKRILEARESRVVEGHGNDHIPDVDTGISIEFRDVALQYPGRDTPALGGVSNRIEKGQFVALVGASGSGKTSIISLLERFYEPYHGQILFNGRDISELDVYAYRRHLALVAQDPALFQGTIRDNILLGMDSNIVTDSQLHAACQDASIHEFITSLPAGYNTDIGSRGIALSGGQKQRIAIARALIRNPKVLLLDEATSSLDSDSERIVQAAIERAAKGRTVMVVAHRLATVRNADVIFVLGDRGRVLEEGSHEGLIAKRGVYYRMCQSQALDQ